MRCNNSKDCAAESRNRHNSLALASVLGTRRPAPRWPPGPAGAGGVYPRHGPTSHWWARSMLVHGRRGMRAG